VMIPKATTNAPNNACLAVILAAALFLAA